jgi:hypothetical protein
VRACFGFSDAAAALASATGQQHNAGGVNSRLNDTQEPARSSQQIPVPDTFTLAQSKPIMELELESNSDWDRTEHEEVVQLDQNWPGTGKDSSNMQ